MNDGSRIIFKLCSSSTDGCTSLGSKTGLKTAHALQLEKQGGRGCGRLLVWWRRLGQNIKTDRH
jgi:hypothetical protein